MEQSNNEQIFNQTHFKLGKTFQNDPDASTSMSMVQGMESKCDIETMNQDLEKMIGPNTFSD